MFFLFFNNHVIDCILNHSDNYLNKKSLVDCMRVNLSSFNPVLIISLFLVIILIIGSCENFINESYGLDIHSLGSAYKKGDELKRHKDRPSCEISCTLNLGGDPWPIFIDGTGADNVIDEYKNIHKPNAPAGTKVLLEVGDMLVYSGCELEHWREPFDGNICGQVFLHYNHVNGPFADKNRFDGRAKLGLPSFCK